jgi:hypothetical protein
VVAADPAGAGVAVVVEPVVVPVAGGVVDVPAGVEPVTVVVALAVAAAGVAGAS